MDDKPPPYSPPEGYQAAPQSAPYPSNFQYSSPLPPPPPPPPPSAVPPGFHTIPENTLPTYGSTVYIQQPPATQVIFVGGCPACRVGVLEDDFTCLGVFLAICLFPIGILCCLALRQRRCPNCGAIFG